MNLSICLRINGHIEARNYPLFKTRPVYTMTTPPKEVPRRLTFRSGKRNQRLAQRPVTENPLYRSWPTGGSRRREPCDIAPSALPARLQPDPGIFERQIVNSRRTLRQAKREGWSFACRSPGTEGPKRSKRRRDAGIVSDHICAVGRIRLNGRAGAKARVVDYAVAGHDRLRGINLDHLVVESVADQGVAVGQPHRARRQRRWIAARTRVGEVLPEHFVVGINFDDATVVRVGKQGMAVGEPARESDSADGAAGGKGRDDLARGGVRDLDGAVVVLVGDEDVAVGQQLGGVGIVELVGTDAHDAVLPILPDDGIVRAPYLDDALVALIRDEHVSARRQIGVLHRRVELVGSESGDAELTVLPHDIPIRVH